MDDHHPSTLLSQIVGMWTSSTGTILEKLEIIYNYIVDFLQENPPEKDVNNIIHLLSII